MLESMNSLWLNYKSFRVQKGLLRASILVRTEKAMAPHSSILAWKTPWRSLVGCSPWGRKESDMTERLHLHFSLSHIGEGNGNPLQCSCLENPRDGGAWWAAVYGITQNRTRLKRLSSSILVRNSGVIFLITKKSPLELKCPDSSLHTY